MRLKTLISSGGAAAVGAGLIAIALPDHPHAHAHTHAGLTGTATRTADHVWRGSSQTRENPAVPAVPAGLAKQGLHHA